MYGLVNKAIKELIVSEHGEASWQRVRTAAGVDVDEFIRMEQYPDSLTYDLVAAASEELGVPPVKVLEVFGGHWVKYTGQQGYGDLLDMAGATLFDFLENLDALHTRVGLNMDKLRPPSFEVEDRTDHSLVLHYRSVRDGLAPMVTGLLKGLAEKFGVAVDVTLRDSKSDGADHDVFMVALK